MRLSLLICLGAISLINMGCSDLATPSAATHASSPTAIQTVTFPKPSEQATAMSFARSLVTTQPTAPHAISRRATQTARSPEQATARVTAQPTATHTPASPTAIPVATSPEVAEQATAILIAQPTATQELSPTAESSEQATAIPFDNALLTDQNAPPTAAASLPEAETKPGEPVWVTIDTIQLAEPVVGVGLDAQRVPIVPKHEVGWYIYSALPGQGENVVLWGHVLRFSDTPEIPAPFARVHEAALGDTITVSTIDGIAHTYVVTAKIWAMPDQIEYILPQGHERLTLVSCIGDQVVVNGMLDMTHRLITIGEPIPATQQ